MGTDRHDTEGTDVRRMRDLTRRLARDEDREPEPPGTGTIASKPSTDDGAQTLDSKMAQQAARGGAPREADR